jgi:hypothetical protein
MGQQEIVGRKSHCSTKSLIFLKFLLFIGCKDTKSFSVKKALSLTEQTGKTPQRLIFVAAPD